MGSPSGRRPFARRVPQGIRLFDLGCVLDEVEGLINLPFVDPDSETPIDTLDRFNDFEDITIGHWDQIVELVTAYPVNLWSATFKQIDDTYSDYGSLFGNPIQVLYRGDAYSLGDTGVFDGDRLRVSGGTGDDFAVSVNSRLCITLSVNGVSSQTKITSEPSYSADAVTFTPSPAMDVYLAPALLNGGCQVTHDYTLNGLGVVTYSETDKLDQLRFLYPREVIHDPASELYGEYLDSWNWRRSPFPGPSGDYEDSWRKTNYFRDHIGGVRAGRLITDVSVSVSSLAVADFHTLTDFPTPPTLPGDPLTVQSGGSLTAASQMNGTLTGIIRKGGVTYYVWRDS